VLSFDPKWTILILNKHNYI